jgi:glycosyltransferase involved in cell wall biosynthesis
MNIGFDAKRAYHNKTGLGHYSRTLVCSLAEFFPEHRYFLFNPESSSLFNFHDAKNIHEVLPSSFFSKLAPSIWRSNWARKDLKKLKVDLYHGLSHEIPIGIHKTGIKSVVTIHDLIHERYPGQYKALDRNIYTRKFRYACEHADHVIAISNQTKQDIIDFYKIHPGKISVCYQSCNPAFGNIVSTEEKQRVKQLYKLPDRFWLSVGSIIERKNLLNVCKAIGLIKNEINIPLVVIGDGGTYKQKVQQYIAENHLENHVIFLSDSAVAESSPGFQSATDFPAIYQQALAMIYPSTFEGFGIPVLEALWSSLPVITSNVSCLPEAGGEGAFYINPMQETELAEQMKIIFSDKQLVSKQIEKGLQHAQKFSNLNTASAVMNVYKQLL